MRVLIKQGLDSLLRRLESRPFRALVWTIASIFTSSTVALAVWAMRLIVTQEPNDELLFVTWITVAAVFILTSIFIVLRSEYLEYDPWIDLRYHARLRSRATSDESGFLRKFQRTGFPREITASKISTLNWIEQAFPLTLMLTSVAVSLCFLGLIPTALRVVSFGISWIHLTGAAATLIFAALAIYIGIESGILFPWRQYHTWTHFWTAYWEYVISVFEPSEMASRVVEKRGTWYPLAGWRLWSTDYDLSDDRIREYVTKRARRLLRENSISDTLSESDIELTNYLDSLALYLDVKSSIQHNRDVLDTLSGESHEYRQAITVFEGITSLDSQDILDQLKDIERLLSLVPVAEISLDAFREVYNVDAIDEEYSDEIQSMAESRLEELWNLPGAPLPESLKWITAFYSLVSLAVTWLLPSFG